MLSLDLGLGIPFRFTDMARVSVNDKVMVKFRVR